MPNLEITKRFTFEAAHYLEGYDGLCGHVHGHSYKVEISVAARALVANGQEAGMVMDLTRLKTCVQPVIDRFDHAFIVEHETMAYLHRDDMNIPVRDEIRNESRVVVLGVRPTTENIAAILWADIEPRLPAHVSLVRLRVVETETSWVELRA